jgi:signal transduction histidine kinase
VRSLAHPDKEVAALTDLLQIPIDRNLSERARWLVTFRWLTLTVAAVFVLLANRWLGNVMPMLPLLLTLAGIAIYNIALLYLSMRMEERAEGRRAITSLLHGQIVLDLLALTVLLHYSGGMENPFSLYYVILVVIGSLLTTRQGGFGYATLASVLWVGLLAMEATGILPHYNLSGFRLPIRYQQFSHLFAESFVLVTANYAGAVIASTVMERLRQEEAELYQANASCELRANELADLNQRLKDLDRARSSFVRLVTHELRAPVAAIQSYLRLILDGYVPMERLQEIVGKAEQRARDQLELIADLLDLAHLQDPSEQAPAPPTALCAVMDDVLDMMQARILDKALDVRVCAPRPGPLVPASPEHTKQIWINLISNAVKYTPSGGKVSILVEERGDRVLGSVTDTGIGIAPDEQEHIFEDFFRTEAAKAMETRGTGLGLSIVKGIMGRYGGRIWLESEVGKGSTFFFELPVAPGT